MWRFHTRSQDEKERVVAPLKYIDGVTQDRAVTSLGPATIRQYRSSFRQSSDLL